MNQADAAQRMLQMTTGYWVTQIIHALAALSVAEHLSKGPRTATEIARLESANPDAVYRLLRAAASLGIVIGDADGQFQRTPMLNTLHRDVPGSLRGFAMSQPEPGHWLPRGRFVDAVRTGQHQTVSALGSEIFDYYAKNPIEAEAFTQSMAGFSALVASEAVRIIDLTTVSDALDVGGANGALVRALMQSKPRLRGSVLDLPHVLESAREAAKSSGLGDRFTAIVGDFFEAVPPADLYLLKFVLHDWDDDQCQTILSNCAHSLRPGGRVVVIEVLLGEVGEPGFGPLLDLNMLVMTKGRERSLKDYERLFEKSGLRLTKVSPTQSPYSILEATANGEAKIVRSK